MYKRQEGVELSELAMELNQQYYAVMVDEYQDVNDLQEAILQGVSREENLFMVGDVKQSIYGFRMANPQLFSEKYQSFSSEGQAQKQRLDLNRNFRCRRNIVDGVNTVFAELMTGENGDLLYDEQAALVYGADYPAPLEGQGDIPEQIQLLVLTQPEEEAEETAEQPLSAMEEEGLLPVSYTHLDVYKRQGQHVGLRPLGCGAEEQREEGLVEEVRPGKPLQRGSGRRHSDESPGVGGLRSRGGLLLSLIHI